MARATFTTTTDWQRIASGAVVATILKRGRGTIFVNEAATEVDASRFGSDIKANDQFQQFSDVETWVRHSDEGTPWELLLDGDVFVPPVELSPGFGDGFGDGFD